MSEADKAKRRMMGEPEPPNPHYKYQNSRNTEKSKRRKKPVLERIAKGIPKNSWLRDGQLPSLWTMARIQFGMGILNVGMTLLAAAIGITIVLTQSSYGNAGIMYAQKTVVVSLGIAGLVFTTATAVFMLGAAITSYLARLNDRQTENLIGDEHQMSSPQAKQPSPPAGGVVPKGPFTDITVNETPLKSGLQTHEEE